MTGVVVDAGDAVTHVVPVVNGQSHAAHVKRLPIAGRRVTEHLADLLRRRGYTLGAGDLEGVRELKHRSCFVAKDYRRELQLARNTTFLLSEYTLPDGQVVRLGQERFQAAEGEKGWGLRWKGWGSKDGRGLCEGSQALLPYREAWGQRAARRLPALLSALHLNPSTLDLRPSRPLPAAPAGRGGPRRL